MITKQTSDVLLPKEENLINWEEILKKFNKTFGSDIYESWIKNISLKKEFNHYFVLSAPTRFVRDWIVSRYADKILDIIKTSKKSIDRIEFLIEENQDKFIKSDLLKKNQVTSIENSLLNYNRFNSNNRFDNFVIGESNELAYTAARKICIDSAHYNPLFIYSAVGMGKTHLLNSIGLEVSNTKKVMFISAERFMYHFIRSIKNNEMVKFKDFLGEQIFLLLMTYSLLAERKLCKKSFFILLMH